MISLCGPPPCAMNPTKTDPWAGDLEKPENRGIVEFLRSMPQDEVMALVRTITAGLVATQDLDEAISVILHFSDGVSLLNRKRVKKEYLANYLISRRIQFSPQSDKSKLCNTVLAHWKQDSSGMPSVTSSAATTRTTSDLNANSRTGPAMNSSCSPPFSDANMIVYNRSETSVVFEEVEMDDSRLERDLRRQHRIRSGIELSYEFAQWFYPRLNTLDDFIPGHFWNDCSFNMVLHTNGETRSYSVANNGVQVHALLSRMVVEEKVGLNPNTLHGTGVRGKLNPHGLGQVAVCGTVHKGPAVFGVFEQTFGLIKDPTDQNNFKIKFSTLKIREAGGGFLALDSNVSAIAPAPSLSIEVLEELEEDD